MSFLLVFFNMDACLCCHFSGRIICSSKPIFIWELTFAYLVFVNTGSYSQQVESATPSLTSRQLCQVIFFHCSISPGLWVLPKYTPICERGFQKYKKEINIFQKNGRFLNRPKYLRTVNPNILFSSKLWVTQLCCAAWQFFVWKVRAGFIICLACYIVSLFSEG